MGFLTEARQGGISCGGEGRKGWKGEKKICLAREEKRQEIRGAPVCTEGAVRKHNLTARSTLAIILLVVHH